LTFPLKLTHFTIFVLENRIFGADGGGEVTWVTFFCWIKIFKTVSEFNEFKPRLKSPKNRF